MFLILLLLALVGNLHLSEASRILVMSVMGTKRHTAVFEPLYHELVRRGHNVTIVTSFTPQESPPGMMYVKAYDISAFNQFMNGNLSESRLLLNGIVLTRFEDLLEAFAKACQLFYENPEVIRLPEEYYDLVIVNSFANECVYGLVSQFKRAKVMTFSTVPLSHWTSSLFGDEVQRSIHRLFTHGLTDQIAFSERMYNFATVSKDFYLKYFLYNRRMEAIYRPYFSNAWSISDFEAKVQLFLVNFHSITNYPRSNFPNMIEISGVHCREAKPLPQDLEDFIQGAGEHGFIYFSMGSFVQGKDLPEEFRIVFLEAFRKLKQRVIWKFETEEMPNLPPNVKLAKWLPQQDILAHPSNRLFITHGGLFSVQEAVYHGVPLLGIPLSEDQEANLASAEIKGIALILGFNEISESIVSQKINAILSHDSPFKSNAKLIASQIFRDYSMAPLDTAVYWIEYLLRHNETSQVYPPTPSLNSFQYHSLDSIGLQLLFTCAIIYIILKIVKLILKFVLCRFRQNKSASPPEPQIKKEKVR